MADINTIKEYLVGLGFSVNQQQYKQMQDTLAQLHQKVEGHTSGMAKSFVGAAGLIVGALTSVSVATAGLLDKLQEAEMGYKKFALRMFMSPEYAKRFKIAQDTMGESLDDIAWIPELRKRFQTLMDFQQKMAQAPGYQKQVERLYQLRTEWEKFHIIMRRGLEWIGSALVRNGVADKFEAFIQRVNNWLVKNMPDWTDKVGAFLARGVSLLGALGKAVGDIFSWFNKASPEIKKYGLLGAILGFGLAPGPLWGLRMFTTLLSGVILLIEDYYYWAEGKKSANILKPFWEEFTKFKDNPKAKLKEYWGDILKVIQDSWDAIMKYIGTKWDEFDKALEKWVQSLPKRIWKWISESIFGPETPEQPSAQQGGPKNWFTYTPPEGGRRKQLERLQNDLGNFWLQSQSGSDGSTANNMGNIRAGRAGFRSFVSPEAGVASAANLLRRSYRGLTLSGIGYKWAPPSENNTEAWIQNVSRASGISPYSVPDLDNPAVLQSLLTGIAAAEKSKRDLKRFTPDVMSRGVGAALGRAYEQLSSNYYPGKYGGGSSGAVVINNNVGDINVTVANPNADPKEIAKEVKREIKRETDMQTVRSLRDFQPVFS